MLMGDSCRSCRTIPTLKSSNGILRRCGWLRMTGSERDCSAPPSFWRRPESRLPALATCNPRRLPWIPALARIQGNPGGLLSVVGKPCDRTERTLRPFEVIPFSVRGEPVEPPAGDQSCLPKRSFDRLRISGLVRITFWPRTSFWRRPESRLPALASLR